MSKLGRNPQPIVVALVLTAIMLLSVLGAVATTANVGHSVSVPIKVLLIGFDQIDLSYLSWTGDSRNLPSSIVNVDLISGNTTGVVFHPQYDVTFAPGSFKQNLVAYLGSIAKQAHGRNPWFGQYQVDKENPDYYISVLTRINCT